MAIAGVVLIENFTVSAGPENTFTISSYSVPFGRSLIPLFLKTGPHFAVMAEVIQKVSTASHYYSIWNAIIGRNSSPSDLDSSNRTVAVCCQLTSKKKVCGFWDSSVHILCWLVFLCQLDTL